MNRAFGGSLDILGGWPQAVASCSLLLSSFIAPANLCACLQSTMLGAMCASPLWSTLSMSTGQLCQRTWTRPTAYARRASLVPPGCYWLRQKAYTEQWPHTAAGAPAAGASKGRQHRDDRQRGWGPDILKKRHSLRYDERCESEHGSEAVLQPQVVAHRPDPLERSCAAAMDQLTKNLACEWGPSNGIRVNCIKPW